MLVTFPAASTIFTDPGEYGLSNTQYGTMFLPQVLTAVATSLLGGSLSSTRCWLGTALAPVFVAIFVGLGFWSGRFWVFAAFAVLYGVCETINGNRAQLDMTRQVGASATLASSLVLTTRRPTTAPVRA